MGVGRCAPTAHRLWRDRGVTRAISTGSGIALGYLPYLAARGVSCHYIESATRISGPSLTGRVLQRTPRVHRYTQCRNWAAPRWRYAGSVFDGFAAGRKAPSGTDGVIRVVVTVGTDRDSAFSRLVERLVPLLAERGDLAMATGCTVQVLWQTGCTPTGHLPIQALPFLSAERLWAALGAADIVVSHAGTGSSLAALTVGRLPVLASRSPRYDETVDGHQVELGDELHRRGLAVHREAHLVSVEDLLQALGSVVHRRCDPPAFELLS
jgi:UDP-N-acetylglucosamine transferase subunit ALG13